MSIDSYMQVAKRSTSQSNIEYPSSLSMTDAQKTYDCFLSHNSVDKPAVRALAYELHARGISYWLDEEHLRPGIPWQPLLEAGIRASRSVAVLVGEDGLGPWELEEMRAALSLAVRDGRPVIPVLLADAPTTPELPLFLGERTWVDLRSLDNVGNSSEFDRLVWGITGSRPGLIPHDLLSANARRDDFQDRQSAIAPSTNLSRIALLKQDNKLNQYSAEFFNYLDGLEDQLNWQHSEFVPLEADIDLITKDNKIKKTGDLLSTIRKNINSKLFILLGDPGSGKSVALRKLTREMLADVSRGGRLPLYINLREWRVLEQAISEDTLRNFILYNLRTQLSQMTYDKVSSNINTLIDAGVLFFIFDSFDETPVILDSNETSTVIHNLSAVIYKFM